MLVQLDLDKKYCFAYDIIARSHEESRREYITRFLEEAAERVPGLMDRVQKEMFNEPIEQDDAQEVRPYRNSLLKPEPPEEVKRYRFSYLDESRGSIEGEGTSAGKALANALGLPPGKYMDPVKYHEEFRSPERLD